MLGRKSHDNTTGPPTWENSDKNKMLSNFATFRPRSQDDPVQTKFPSHFSRSEKKIRAQWRPQTTGEEERRSRPYKFNDQRKLWVRRMIATKAPVVHASGYGWRLGRKSARKRRVFSELTNVLWTVKSQPGQSAEQKRQVNQCRSPAQSKTPEELER